MYTTAGCAITVARREVFGLCGNRGSPSSFLACELLLRTFAAASLCNNFHAVRYESLIGGGRTAGSKALDEASPAITAPAQGADSAAKIGYSTARKPV